jgi:oligopeptide/dipeptide ABC transporter ATP-binding protein
VSSESATAMASGKAGPTLRVRGLTTRFELSRHTVKAVDGIDLEVARGQTACIVGESGSGKSVTGLSILRLVPSPGRIVGGVIELNGVNLLDLSDQAMERVRGPEATMIFQNPRAALDPFFKIGDQLAETAAVQMGLKRRAARETAKEFLAAARISQVDRIMEGYPHQLSGGECQRVMIAMALICRPKLLIADEPTSALDAKVQSELLELLHEVKDEFNMAVVLITHDIGVVEQIADQVYVMYAGKIVETGTAREILSSPQHPYTIGLMNSVPKIGERARRLKQIDGQPPDPSALPPGCSFVPRCAERVPLCKRIEPLLEPVGHARLARCHLRGENPTERDTHVAAR